MIFLDTCVLIDYSKNKISISKQNYCFNSIVQLEFTVGAINKRELKKINTILSEFKLLDTEQEILNLSVNLVNKYSLSHNMTIYDSIIAATCLIYDLPLWTYNKKDFKYIENLVLVDGDIIA
jgi:predicted nucleic acid-binding protein